MRKKLLILAAAGVFALGACSDDEYSQGDFMSECQEDGGLTEEQCRCAWDEIKDEVSGSDLQALAEADPEDVDTEVAGKVAGAITSCTSGG